MDSRNFESVLENTKNLKLWRVCLKILIKSKIKILFANNESYFNPDNQRIPL